VLRITGKHTVVSLTRGSWALFPPGDRDLMGRQPSGNLLP
jgi:hypothetical protein